MSRSLCIKPRLFPWALGRRKCLWSSLVNWIVSSNLWAPTAGTGRPDDMVINPSRGVQYTHDVWNWAAWSKPIYQYIYISSFEHVTCESHFSWVGDLEICCIWRVQRIIGMLHDPTIAGSSCSEQMNVPCVHLHASICRFKHFITNTCTFCSSTIFSLFSEENLCFEHAEICGLFSNGLHTLGLCANWETRASCCTREQGSGGCLEMFLWIPSCDTFSHRLHS